VLEERCLCKVRRGSCCWSHLCPQLGPRPWMSFLLPGRAQNRTCGKCSDIGGSLSRISVRHAWTSGTCGRSREMPASCTHISSVALEVLERVVQPDHAYVLQSGRTSRDGGNRQACTSRATWPGDPSLLCPPLPERKTQNLQGKTVSHGAVRRG